MMYIICLDSQIISSTQIKHQWQENTIRKHNSPLSLCVRVLLQMVNDWILKGQDISGLHATMLLFLHSLTTKAQTNPTPPESAFPAVTEHTRGVDITSHVWAQTYSLQEACFRAAEERLASVPVGQRFSRVWSATKCQNYSIKLKSILSFKNSTLDKCHCVQVPSGHSL